MRKRFKNSFEWALDIKSVCVTGNIKPKVSMFPVVGGGKIIIKGSVIVFKL